MKTIEDYLKKENLKRGEALSKFARVENLMIIFISNHYFEGQRNKEFEEELLSDKYFSFGLLHNIFLKVLKKYSEYTSFPNAKLERLAKNRNKIAHSLLQKLWDEEQLYKEFESDIELVFSFLRKMLKEKFNLSA